MDATTYEGVSDKTLEMRLARTLPGTRCGSQSG